MIKYSTPTRMTKILKGGNTKWWQSYEATVIPVHTSAGIINGYSRFQKWHGRTY